MKLKKLSMILGLAVFMTGCQKDFLDKYPKDKLVPETAFQTYENFTTYSWGLYDIFGGYGSFTPEDGAEGYPPSIQQEFDSDNMSQSVSGRMSDYAFQTKIIPASGGHSRTKVTASWNFSYIRRVNVMLDRIDLSEMTPVEKDHWRSVGYFFRALRYYDMIAAFGDVPWIEHALTDTSSQLYAKRTPRDVVAKNVLNNLQWAETHIKPDGDEPNTINVHVVRALISRFGLFEGTWRKYHGLGDADTYLQASKTASEKLLAAFPSIIDNYDEVFNSEKLGGKPGIILYKQYEPNLTPNSLPRYIGSTSWHADLTKDAIESYLCTDGRPISTSVDYDGDHSMYDEFRNRDRRLYYTVVPPYKVTLPTKTTWARTNKPADAEYLDLMDQIGGASKALPMQAWSKNWDTGNVIAMSPHFRNYNVGASQAISELGYFFWKFYNRFPLDDKNNSPHDAPLFRIGEVMLNYAEVMWELGEFNQAVAAATINKLRDRAYIAPMVVADIDANFDLKRDPTVDPVLWEIRRERRVELMGDGFRFNDLKRWKKGEYLNKQKTGVWVKNSEFNNKLKIKGGGPEGYVEFFGQPLGWLDKYYLEPIPTQDLVLNPNLDPNPGWED